MVVTLLSQQITGVAAEQADRDASELDAMDAAHASRPRTALARPPADVSSAATTLDVGPTLAAGTLRLSFVTFPHTP